MATKTLSRRQSDMLRFIREYTAKHNYPPSIRDFMREVPISSSSVVIYNLDILEREGFIRRERDVSRSIVLLEELDQPAQNTRCPNCGMQFDSTKFEVK